MDWVLEETEDIKTVPEHIELVERAQQGDIDAFELLIYQNKAMLYRIGVNILKSDFDTADAIQETLFIAYKKLPQLRQTQYFKTWLVRILMNECKKISKKRKKELSIESESYQDTSYEIKEVEDELKSYIELLAPKLQQVVFLKYYEEFKITEIKRILGIPESTVKTRLRTAKKQLMSLMLEGNR